MNGMSRAQAQYDAQMPPEACYCVCQACGGAGCEKCNDEGTVENMHKWKRIPGQANDGTTFARCIRCGKVEES